MNLIQRIRGLLARPEPKAEPPSFPPSSGSLPSIVNVVREADQSDPGWGTITITNMRSTEAGRVDVAVTRAEIIADVNETDLHPGAWAKLDQQGNLLMIDWDAAERLAELHRAKRRQDDVTAIACLAIAVREHVLTTQAPTIKPRG